MIITTWYSYELFFRIIETILLEQLYVPILYGCVGVSLYLMVYPIRSRLRILKLFRESKKEIVVYGFLFIVIVTHTVYFSSDPAFMLTKIQSQIITDRDLLKEASDLKMWAEYLVLPFLYAILVAQSRTILYGNEQVELDSIKGSWKIAIVITIIVAGTYILFRVVSPLL